MAASGGVVSGSACQGLLRTVARPRTRSRLLARTTRWISSEEQATRAETSSLRRLLGEFSQPFKTIDQSSIAPCRERVRVVDSDVRCLCSWNEASGSTQAIHVPGDASRPRTTSPSLSGLAHTADASLAPAAESRPLGYCNPGRGPRGSAWDDCLAALCATEPELKLDDVDVMIGDDVVFHLLLVAQNGKVPYFGNPLRTIKRWAAFDMILVGNTLVMKRRNPDRPIERIKIPSRMPSTFWEYYKVSTEAVPAVEDSSVHHQLLRYNIGPLSCLVKVRVHGTVQEMPTSTGPSEAQQPRNLHGVDVIRAGQGVNPAFAFQAIARRANSGPDTELRRLKTLTAHLWLSGQTRLGIANIVPVEQVEELGGLTVVEMSELVTRYENMNQKGLRRLVGLLDALRRTVRESGGPCVGELVCPPGTTRRTMAGQLYAVKVHRAGPNEDPILLDSHKEQFWSQENVPRKQVQPRSKAAMGQPRPQGKVNDEHVDAPKGFFRKWAQWLGL